MASDVQKFYEVVKNDPALQEEVKQIFAVDVEALIALGAKHGFTMSRDDINEAMAAERELTEEDLEMVSGGYSSGGLCCFNGIDQLEKSW